MATKHAEIANQLRGDIAAGVFAPGAPLPSERQLRERFDVGRHTVRTALDTLRAEGAIVIINGKGAFVQARPLRPAHRYEAAITTSGGTSRAKTGATYSTALDDAATIEDPVWFREPAAQDVALTLGVPGTQGVWTCDRVFDLDGARVAHRLYMPQPVVADVPGLRRNPHPLPGVLYTAFAAAGLTPTISDSISARMPTPDEASTLAIPPATPMLVLRRLTSHRDRPLALEEYRYNAASAELVYPAPIVKAGR